MKITSENLTQYCFQEIERDIITNVLKPAQKLVIDDLKGRFGVGHTPIREALSRLVATGLVEIKHNRGFYVAQVSESDIRDIYRTFNQIENLALEQAIALGDDRWAATIVAALYELSLVENNKNDADQTIWTERNAAFHFALIAGCQSSALLQIRDVLYKRFDRYCRLSFLCIKTKLSHNYTAHKELADAVLARDTKRAMKLMTWHIMGSLEEVIMILHKRNML